MEIRGKRIKVVNRMFMEAEHSFSLLRFYYREITALLRMRAEDFLKTTDEIEENHKKRQRPFDREFWLEHFDVYSEFYPTLFSNSFIIWACAMFESHIRKICALVKEEHKVPLEWEDMKGSVPSRAKNYLWYGGVVLKDDPPTIVLPPPNFVPTEVFDENRVIAERLWSELRNYFRVRNCITHYSGSISKMRHKKRTRKYALKKGILIDNNGQQELRLTQDFNNEVCDTMAIFFSKLKGDYYNTPLPE